MGSIVDSTAAAEQPSPGNLSILTKVDKLRELVGTKTALPQLVVVGDQSSGKSSVLEGLTGFAFPRDAELCTRYATQITCRRESEESIYVSIIPHAEAPRHEQERIRDFHRTLKEMDPESLASLFKEANETMGIRNSAESTSLDVSSLPAFSEHILKIEKLGPNEEHFTVIDVPGIFRKETEGVTTEDDIELVRNMVKNYRQSDDVRSSMGYNKNANLTRSLSSILAIMPSNVDPATQEILKLAKKADPSMTRTMAVLTKPDLAIERATQQIAIDHVTGARSDLTLGYYIVKNRGPDDVGKTLKQGQADENMFFSTAPWSVLRRTGKAGISALRTRVRELLIDLIKREFPKVKVDIIKELSSLKSERDKMGPSRGDEYTQRTFLNQMSESFQDLARSALSAHYKDNKSFDEKDDLRLITRIVEANEKYSEDMEKHGHMREFAGDADPKKRNEIPTMQAPPPDDSSFFEEPLYDEYPELDEIFDPSDTILPDFGGKDDDIMGYIDKVYRSSRGQELGTFSGALISTMFKEQSKKWEPITMAYMAKVIIAVHRFIVEIFKVICPDSRVRDELWDVYLLEELQKSYRRAMDHVKFLLEIEREGAPLTLNHYFNENLQKDQGNRLIATIEGLGSVQSTEILDEYGNGTGKYKDDILLNRKQLENLSVNMANSDYTLKYIHDILKSYYKVSRKRFVDVVCQQAVNHHLLAGKGSPLKIFSTQMVLNLNEDQLDMIAGEDAPVKMQREKLASSIKNFEGALKVLKGSG
ncbi:hypothetical protein AAE478_001782 [Parahypoxylon ruwenzoriense]